MAKQFDPRDLLSKLPLEEQVDTLLDRLAEKIRLNRITEFLDELRNLAPKVPSGTIPTPFGEVTIPSINPLPEFTPPEMGPREKDILKASIAMDLASILGWIPVIGDYFEEELTDLYGARMRSLMTEREYELFEKYDKINPLDSLAAMRAIIHARRE